ncbi:MAG: hypothetical protein F4137_01540 [Acidobacteria bacterium]|nr:hypothetical protein [Acidobacteriota bacterium]
MYKRFAKFVSLASAVVLWIAITDAAVVFSLLSCTTASSNGAECAIDPPDVILLGMLSIVPTAAISALFRLGAHQHYLQRSLAAGSVGVLLILTEASTRMFYGVEMGFNFEELLLASGGLNMLMEEARLTREYQGLLERRRQAEEEADKIIKDVAGFRRSMIVQFDSIIRNPKRGKESR